MLLAFGLGLVIGLIVASVAACQVGSQLVNEYRALHERAIGVYSHLHEDALNHVDHFAQKAANVEKAIAG